MRVCDIIHKKRCGQKLTAEEIYSLVSGYTDSSVPDYQMSAFLMAVCFQGMDKEEISALTKAMTESGETYDLSSIKAPKIDKHSTGGVGDGVSLVLAPLAASCGVCVPMMSGRALGHTGGTLDKLGSIPGFKTDIPQAQYKRMLEKIGVSMIGQSEKIAPADRKIYALRDVTATVDSIPLIAASIMSKKIAEGCDGLLLDVKAGNGAFMKTAKEAGELAETMVSIGKSAGIDTRAVITDMNQPLGNAVGNALEIKQAIEVLKGRGPADFVELSIELAARMIVMAKLEKDMEKARIKARCALTGLKALKKFEEIIIFQGGNPEVIQKPDRILPRAPKTKDIFPDRSGYMKYSDTAKTGIAAIYLGAGRKTKEDGIDNSAGIIIHKKNGDKISTKEPLAIFYYGSQGDAECAEKVFRESFEIAEKKPSAGPLIMEEII